MSSPSRILRTVLWRRNDLSSLEYFSLRRGDGWELRGTVILALDGSPSRVRYGVICDAEWRTVSVHIAQQRGHGEEALHLTAADGAWRARSGHLAQLDGCEDVDLAITPATNTLPIRRLNLEVGQTVTVRAAWILFPSLSVQPLIQDYTRLGPNRYRYQSPNFTADIEVDDLGLVERYDSLWERIATGGNVVEQ